MKLSVLKENFHEVKYQLIGTLCANLLGLSYGFLGCWIGSFLPLLQSDETPLSTGPLDVHEASWLGSIPMIGAVACNLILGPISAIIGRKRALCLLTIPYTLFLVLTYFAKTVYYLYVARFMAGVMGGGIYCILPLYVAEIAGKDIRGTLSGFMLFSISIGILVGFILAPYSGYHIFSLTFMPFGIISFLAFIFLPETPLSLLRRKQFKAAEQSLRYYNNYGDIPMEKCEKFKTEFEDLQLLAHSNEKTPRKFSLKDICTREARFAILIGSFVMLLSELSGSNVLMTYTATIFINTGSSTDPYVASAIAALTQLLGIICSMVLVDVAGRKLLLLVSSIGTCICLVVTGVFTYLSKTGYDVTPIEWLPVVSLCGVILLGAIGITSLCYTIVTEIFPNDLRSFGNVFCMFVRGTCTFIVLKTYPILNEAIDFDGCMWLYASICAAGAIIIAFFLPETKGKNLNTVDQS